MIKEADLYNEALKSFRDNWRGQGLMNKKGDKK